MHDRDHYILHVYSLEGESTSVTLFPSAKTAYPVTGANLFAVLLPTVPSESTVVFKVTGIHVTRIVPSCGPPSTRTSIGGSGRAKFRMKPNRFTPSETESREIGFTYSLFKIKDKLKKTKELES